MIEFQAPGKAVIWGEYAVLAGAPALVMAVNRYASVSVAARQAGWHIVSRGFVDEALFSSAELGQARADSSGGAAAVIRAALAAYENPAIPAGAEVRTDTTDFHDGANKLGIGSSAAVCTAACAALGEFLNLPFSYERALRAHQALQGKAGSGLDVAAACHGGLLRFQERRTVAARWPDGLHFRFFWVGHSAKTTDHLSRFAAWRRSGEAAPLRDLCRASERLFDRADMAAFAEYTGCLKHLDEAANLGIFGTAHKRLDELAKRAEVVYKPCGAGGGDIGIAVSDDASALDAFITLAARESYLSLDLEIAAHGVHRIRN